MRKLFLLVIVTVNALSTSAKIDYNINKYGVMIVYFVSDTDSVSSEQFRIDWSEAIKVAANEKKVKQIQMKDNKGEIIGWAYTNNLSSLNQTIEELISEFKNFDEYEIIYGDSIKKTIITPAQYHSDTYRNGSKESSYSSDWNQGYFAPKTSTYRTGGDIYTTKTYYTPKKTENIWERPIKERKIIKSGEAYRLSQIYKIR